MKKIFTVALMALSIGAQAQEKNNILTDTKISGYIVSQYQANLQDKKENNTFNLRYIRVSLGGRIMNDFEYKIQAQMNGNTSTLGTSPRIVDAFAEWQKYSFFKVKVGQFKRSFTFENPINPIVQGFMGYSQLVSKLSGMSDRTGEHSANGRDLGVQIQGDFLPNANGRNLLHYQVGVFNGQGTNTKDVDNRKDVIGGVWVMPIKGMRVGVFGWAGSHARNGVWTDQQGNQHSGINSLSQYRYAFSADYVKGEWQLRTEYAHSTGYGFKTTYQKQEDTKDASVNWAQGNKADAFYVSAIAPIIKGKLRAKARYDLYRKSASWDTSKTNYEVGLNYSFNKNIELQTEYVLVDDRSLEKNYSMIDAQLSFKF